MLADLGNLVSLVLYKSNNGVSSCVSFYSTMQSFKVLIVSLKLGSAIYKVVEGLFACNFLSIIKDGPKFE
jgi:hypothetical protein